MVWCEVMVHDQPTAVAFYQRVFGYTVEDLSAPGFTYASLSLDGHPAAGVGGYGAQAGIGAPAAWTIYFAVTDTDAAAARVAELGGTVVSAPTDSAFGRMAIVSGPFGEVFALIGPVAGSWLTASSGPGARGSRTAAPRLADREPPVRRVPARGRAPARAAAHVPPAPRSPEPRARGRPRAPVATARVLGARPGLTDAATADGLLDATALFGRSAPLVLEIGSGMGETTAAMAAADPSRDYLAVEAHLPGVANLLGLLDRAGPHQRPGRPRRRPRPAPDRAAAWPRRHGPSGLDAVHVFFPDPWPKARHHKRRLVQPSHVALLRSRLRVGGTLHCATDWVDYADAMLEALTADPFLENTADGFTPRPAHRPVTKFEQRGLDLGHEVRDLVFRRVR